MENPKEIQGWDFLLRIAQHLAPGPIDIQKCSIGRQALNQVARSIQEITRLLPPPKLSGLVIALAQGDLHAGWQRFQIKACRIFDQIIRHTRAERLGGQLFAANLRDQDHHPVPHAIQQIERGPVFEGFIGKHEVKMARRQALPRRRHTVCPFAIPREPLGRHQPVQSPCIRVVLPDP